VCLLDMQITHELISRVNIVQIFYINVKEVTKQA